MAVVAWPPPTPPNTRANTTVELDNHPLDHNRIADALDTIIAKLALTPMVLFSAVPAPSGLPYNIAFTLPRAVTAGVLMVYGTVYSAGTGPVTVGIGIDSTWRSQAKGYNDGPGNTRRGLAPAAFTVPALASGAHQLNFRDDLAAGGDAGDFWTAVLWSIL